MPTTEDAMYGSVRSTRFVYPSMEDLLYKYIFLNDAMDQWKSNDSSRSFEIDIYLGEGSYTLVITTFVSYEV